MDKEAAFEIPIASVAGALTGMGAASYFAHHSDRVARSLPSVPRKQVAEMLEAQKLPKELPVLKDPSMRGNAAYIPPTFFSNETSPPEDRYGMILHGPDMKRYPILAHEGGHAQIQLNNPWYHPSRVNQNLLRTLSFFASRLAYPAAAIAGNYTRSPLVGAGVGLVGGGLLGLPTIANEYHASSLAQKYLDARKAEPEEKEKERQALRSAFMSYLSNSLVGPAASGAIGSALPEVVRSRAKAADAVPLSDLKEVSHPLAQIREEGFSGFAPPDATGLEEYAVPALAAGVSLPALYYLLQPELAARAQSVKKRKKPSTGLLAPFFGKRAEADMASWLEQPRTLLSHLPRIRLPDSVVGIGAGVPLAYAGEWLTRSRSLSPEQAKARQRRWMAGGALAGLGVGNLVGDRARRYITNVMPPLDYSNREKFVVPREKVISNDNYGEKAIPDVNTPIDQKGIWRALVEDKPIWPRYGKTTGDRALAAAHRYEITRRNFGVHSDTPSNLMETNSDNSLSISRTSPVMQEAVRALLLPDDGPIKNPSQLAAAINRGTATDKVEYDKGHMAKIVGGQYVASYPLDPEGGSKHIHHVRDRWDYTLNPREVKFRNKALWDKVFNPASLKNEIGSDPPDYLTAKDTRDAGLKSLLIRTLVNNFLVHRDPWITQKLLFNVDEVGGNTKITPMTWDDKPYAVPPAVRSTSAY